MRRTPTIVRVALGAALFTGLAACNVIPGPEAGPPQPSKVLIGEPTVVTAPVAADPVVIGEECSAGLGATPEGAEVLDRYTVWLGYWLTQGNPANEVANTVSGFTYEAAELGVVCP